MATSIVYEARDFQSDDTLRLARMLLGKTLVLRRGSTHEAHLITEVEAYDGPDDRASHACRGRRPRNAVMFGPGGNWYVYLVYGIHEMLNLVTGPEGYPAAVLIRGLDSVSGPGRLTRHLGIDRRFNGLSSSPETGLHIEDRSDEDRPHSILCSARIGVDYAGPVWARKPYRFLIGKDQVGKGSIRAHR